MTVIEPGIRQRLVRHLENCVTEIDTDISPTINTSNNTPQEMYKEVINDKRIPIAVIPKCEPTIPSLPTEGLSYRMEVEGPTEQDKKARLEPDSSTAEEINNNAETNFRNENEISRIEEQNIPPQLPNSVIKMYDGNFVFVLPSHYIQLAAALGINLNQQQNGAIPVTEVITTQEPIRNAQNIVEQNIQPIEKPINFSKNNEINDMWRPW